MNWTNYLQLFTITFATAAAAFMIILVVGSVVQSEEKDREIEKLKKELDE